MEPAAAARFREELLAARARLVAEGDAVVAQEEVGPVPSKVDEDEQPHREMSQVLASNRNRERARRLVAIDAALVRLADDPEAFGLCERCGDEIPERRLLLMPWARLCVACQSEVERDLRGHTRRRVTDFRD